MNYFPDVIQDEAVHHFVAVGPIFSHMRKSWFGVSHLDYGDYLSHLNGWDWRLLGKYFKYARH